jgi:hypothetical protein
MHGTFTGDLGTVCGVLVHRPGDKWRRQAIGYSGGRGGGGGEIFRWLNLRQTSGLVYSKALLTRNKKCSSLPHMSSFFSPQFRGISCTPEL